MSSPISSSPMDGENTFSYFSPSPDDRDILKTPPFTEHAERDVFLHHFDFDSSFLLRSDVGEPQHHDGSGSNSMNGLYFPALPVSTLCIPSSTARTHSQCYLPPTVSLPVRASDNSSIAGTRASINIDPFDAAFTVANEERVTYAPLLVQTSFMEACRYSPRFPDGHILNSSFVRAYNLGDELGSGGYGFVMTAYNRAQGLEVAVKFIIKEKVSEHAWIEDAVFGRLPMEVMLLSLVDHENIVKCLDLFEDKFYFYLVQELHGSPWKRLLDVLPLQPRPPPVADNFSSPPLLSPSSSEDSMTDFSPATPVQPPDPAYLHLASNAQIQGSSPSSYHFLIEKHNRLSPEQVFQDKTSLQHYPPRFSRRPSHDLFECIEQTPEKHLSEDQARYIFAQVVEAAYYLDSQGITHRDIKDENLVIDEDLRVKLIDFGSAIIADPTESPPFHHLFFGTAAYASSEILRKLPYQAPPAEVWTLGVLLSYLLTGMSPFPTERDAIDGRIMLAEIPGVKLSKTCLNLMHRCLEPDPERRADINEVRHHKWLK